MRDKKRKASGGGRPTKPRPAREILARLYVEEGRAVREIAGILGESKDMIARALKGYGIKRRLGVKRSRLRTLDQGRLFADIAEKGVDRTAAAWGIPERTLKHYLAQIRRKRP